MMPTYYNNLPGPPPELMADSPDQEVWNHIRSGFKLSHYTYRSEVRKQIAWFRNHPKILHHMLTNSAPYLYYVYEAVNNRGLPTELVLLPVIESAYNPYANSHYGAAGLWQLMPRTARGYGIKHTFWYEGRRDIKDSTYAALNHLTYLYRYFHGDWLLALAAYDAGEGRVGNAMRLNDMYGRSVSYWSLPLPIEAKIYVPRLLALAAIVNSPRYYGVRLPPIKDGPYLGEVNVSKQINLPRAARYAGMSVKELHRLNPAYSRWLTTPKGPHHFLLPLTKIEQFKINLASDKSRSVEELQFAVTTERYRVKKGDTLTRVAQRFHVNVAALKKANHLKHLALHRGQTLVIPNKNMRNAITQLATAETPRSDAASALVTKKISQSHHLYKVKKHDTLWKIAKANHVPVADLKRWNSLSNNALKSGQQLTIRSSEHKSP